MSPSDEHGRGGEARTDGRFGGSGQTRTRLPDRDEPYTARRRSPSRSLATVMGVVVLLVAAIAFANRGSDDSSDDPASADADRPAAGATAPTGDKPVTGTTGGIPSGFGHDAQGAESAAANYAVALGSAEMFDREQRTRILAAVIRPDRLRGFEDTYDKAYVPAFYQRVGLEPDGSAPEGYTFVSRTSPVGTRTTKSGEDRATVEVWCNGLLGLAGEKSTKPVTDSWFTMTMSLAWADGDWKIVTHSQEDGPTPVPGDSRASTADDMAEAVDQYGGFTYAR